MGYFSNGTEGDCFTAEFCERCVHDAAYRHWESNGERGPRPDPCPVWSAHLLFAYELCNAEKHPGKVMLDLLITREDGKPQRCVMYIPESRLKESAAKVARRTQLEARLGELKRGAK